MPSGPPSRTRRSRRSSSGWTAREGRTWPPTPSGAKSYGPGRRGNRAPGPRRSADLWTGTRDYDADQWKRVLGILDRIYEEFTEKAAKGRNLPLEKVREAARGRVWSGEAAKALGLVDELGGFPAASRG